ncbi:MAG: hypothetical protein ACJATT_005896 [Myxococcota bacterium]|jgi:hypothetical protein
MKATRMTKATGTIKAPGTIKATGTMTLVFRASSGASKAVAPSMSATQSSWSVLRSTPSDERPPGLHASKRRDWLGGLCAQVPLIVPKPVLPLDLTNCLNRISSILSPL